MTDRDWIITLIHELFMYSQVVYYVGGMYKPKGEWTGGVVREYSS